MGVLGLDIVLKSCVGENKADNGRDESIVAHAADTEFGREYQKIPEKRFPRFFYPNRAPLCIIDIRAFV